ncbi:MAG: DUF3667 domain-containing protein [Pseudomonadota bacterium]
MSATTPCPNCQAPMPDDALFCSQCGQKRITTKDRGFTALLLASAREVTDLRGRTLPTFLTLLFRPGRLSAAYTNGQRKRFLPPITVFLFANLIFFLTPPITDFNIALFDQATLQPYSAWIKPLIDERVGGDITDADVRNSRDARSVRSEYNATARDLGKTMIILHAPFFALASLLLTVDRRLFYADHVVMALHFLAFLILAYVIVLPLAVPLARYLRELGFAVRAFLPINALIIAYTLVMLRTALGLPWWRVVVSTPILLFAFAWSHTFYRMIQFGVVFMLTA